MFAKPKNLHNFSFQKLCFRHQNTALHGLSLEFHPLGAKNWIQTWFGAPHVYLKCFQGEFCDLFLSHPLQRLHHQMPLLWHLPGWGTLFLPSLLSHVHGLISSLTKTHLIQPLLAQICHIPRIIFLCFIPWELAGILHFKMNSGQGKDKGAKCLEITFGPRILHHTCPLHCFSHPGEWKGLCSKAQSELTSEAGSATVGKEIYCAVGNALGNPGNFPSIPDLP